MEAIMELYLGFLPFLFLLGIFTWFADYGVDILQRYSRRRRAAALRVVRRAERQKCA